METNKDQSSNINVKLENKKPEEYVVVLTQLGCVKVHSTHESFTTAHAMVKLIEKEQFNTSRYVCFPFVQPSWKHFCQNDTVETSILDDDRIPESPTGFKYCGRRNVYDRIDEDKPPEPTLEEFITDLKKKKSTELKKKRRKVEKSSK